MKIYRVLIIAGSDSGGGAGIQADLKTITILGGYGSTVITVLTAQNTLGVQKIHPLPLDFVFEQFTSIKKDIGFDVIKIGMLYSKELMELVFNMLKGLKVPIVLDPVMVAKDGSNLLDPSVVTFFRKHILPLATLLTPNLYEASELLGYPVTDSNQMLSAARDLASLGAKSVLVKGGHLIDSPCDVLYDGVNSWEFKSTRIQTNNTHGTGCTLASACAVLLAKGFDLYSAVLRARKLVRRAIIQNFNIGEGQGPINVMADLDVSLPSCLKEMSAALVRLERCSEMVALMPEVRMQMGYALPGATSLNEVLAISGRITVVNGYLKAAGPLRTGVSSHVAKIILAATTFDFTKRAVLVVKFSESLIRKAFDLGWLVKEFFRKDEPEKIKRQEGLSLEWGILNVVKKIEKVPDLIFDRGEVGKEPIIRILSSNPNKLVDMVFNLIEKN